MQVWKLETLNFLLLGISHWNEFVVTSVFMPIDRLGNVVGNLKPLN